AREATTSAPPAPQEKTLVGASGRGAFFWVRGRERHSWGLGGPADCDPGHRGTALRRRDGWGRSPTGQAPGVPSPWATCEKRSTARRARRLHKGTEPPP